MQRRPFPHFPKVAALLCALLSALSGVGCSEAPAPGSGWPEGALVIGRSEPLRRLLARAGQLEGTPLARAAADLARRLPACDEIEGHAPNGSLGDALSALRCRPEHSALNGVHLAHRADDLVFAVPLDDAPPGRAVGTLSVGADGDLTLVLRLPSAPFSDARALLVPAEDPPGASVLRGSDPIAHARVRPAAGLDLASLVAADGQAERLFRLKNALFAGVVLDGTWEAALYPPAAGGRMPLAALAVGVARRSAAVAAIEAYLGELESTWSVARSPFRVVGGAAAGGAAADGACLLDLNVLPEFAPCYVVGESALVVGWNPASVRRALASGTGTSDLGVTGGLVLDLERMAGADARLARAAGVATPTPQVYPWRRLVARARTAAGGVTYRIELRTDGDA